MAKLRLGIADLLDSRPLAWGFLKGHYSEFFAPSLHPPGRISELLAVGELDIGLVPAIDLARLPSVKVIPDLGVAVASRADTALVMHRQSPAQIERVAVDRHSRSARVLLEIVLKEKYGVTPTLVDHSGVEGWVEGCDASMLIAERALRAQWQGPEVINLTRVWNELYGVPFVFAIWAVGEDVRLPDLSFYFKSSLRYGLSSMDALQREVGAESEVRTNRVKRYLGEQLQFVLTTEDQRGLEKLFELSLGMGLIESIPEIRYL